MEGVRTKGKRVALAAGIAAVAVIAVAAWRGWPHFRFRYLFEPLGRNAQGYLEYRHRKTGIVMVRLPGGKFRMGAQKDDPVAASGSVIRTVRGGGWIFDAGTCRSSDRNWRDSRMIYEDVGFRPV